MARSQKERDLMSKNFKLNLQLFADSATPEEVQTSQNTKESGDATKVYGEDYVKKIRSESANYRTKLRELEKIMEQKQIEFQNNLFKAFGLEPDPNKNYESQIENYKKKAQEAEVKANQKLIKVAIAARAIVEKAKDPADLLKFLDISKLEVEEAGTIKGLDAQIKELKEKKAYLFEIALPSPPGGVNPAGNITKSEEEQLKEEYDNAIKTQNFALQIALKNKIFELQKRSG